MAAAGAAAVALATGGVDLATTTAMGVAPAVPLLWRIRTPARSHVRRLHRHQVATVFSLQSIWHGEGGMLI